MKKLIVAMCMMIFSVFAAQAAPGGYGSGCYVWPGGPGSSFHDQDYGFAASVAVVQNANFERLHGMVAATVATVGKSAYSKNTSLVIAATSNGVLGGGSIGISKTS